MLFLSRYSDAEFIAAATELLDAIHGIPCAEVWRKMQGISERVYNARIPETGGCISSIKTLVLAADISPIAKTRMMLFFEDADRLLHSMIAVYARLQRSPYAGRPVEEIPSFAAAMILMKGFASEAEPEANAT